MKRAIALIDGEHYLSVIKEAIEVLRQDYKVLAAVLIGGTEKITDDTDYSLLSLPVIAESDSYAGFKRTLERYRPDLVVDLSDEPVVGYEERFRLASLALEQGSSYVGADFRFDPPEFHDVCKKPSISIIGTGKRVGKTAISAYIARLLKSKGHKLVVVAMGRGGPKEPEILEGKETQFTPDFLLEASERGKHAASDYFEDALVSSVTTIGCRRCGGGLAGKPFVSNVLQGAVLANEVEGDLVIFEGSGAALPPIKTDSCLNVVGAHQPLSYIGGFFGTYRILLSDLVVLTMCEPPMADEEKVSSIVKAIKAIKPGIKVVRTVFRPRPLGDLDGKKVFFATTALKEVGKIIKDFLEEKFNCCVVGLSHNLSNRKLLREEIAKNKGRFEILLTELKAASVDVATRIGLDIGAEVVYTDNVPVVIGGESLDKELGQLARMTIRRFDMEEIEDAKKTRI